MSESLFIVLGLDPRKSIQPMKKSLSILGETFMFTSGKCSPISQLMLLLELMGNSLSILYLLLKCGSRVLGAKRQLGVRIKYF